jgi:large subunit ribosomal protein L4
MPTVTIVDQTNSNVGSIDLADQVFGVKPHVAAMHQVVRSQMAKARAGTASTKTRSEVAGSGAKPYRQKGTGRARAGRRTSPLWRGGGTTFGPKPRSYAFKVPKKVRRLAMTSALSAKMQAGELVVVDRLELDEIKTRKFAAILKDLEISGKTLVVTGEPETAVALSARNLPDVTVLEANRLNVYDVLNVAKLLMTRDAVEKVSEALSA